MAKAIIKDNKSLIMAFKKGNIMLIQYNLGNFKTGEAKRLFSKEAMLTYVAMGFKLISVAYVTNESFIKECSKGLKK